MKRRWCWLEQAVTEGAWTGVMTMDGCREGEEREGGGVASCVMSTSQG